MTRLDNSLQQQRSSPPPCTCTGPHVDTARTADICDVLSQGHDHDAHHVLWVCWGGHIHLTPLARGQGPTALDERPELKFRLETFRQGDGYVGMKACRNLEWVRQLGAGLKRAWREDSVGHLKW